MRLYSSSRFLGCLAEISLHHVERSGKWTGRVRKQYTAELVVLSLSLPVAPYGAACDRRRYMANKLLWFGTLARSARSFT